MSETIENLKKTLCKEVVSSMDFSRELSDEDAYALIDSAILEYPGKSALSFPEICQLRTSIFNSLRKLDIIQAYLEDDTVTEIMINGRDNIFVERNGLVTRCPECFESDEKLSDIIQQIVAECNRTVNDASPIVDARLSSGERVNIVLNPIALNGPIVTIRRFPSEPITMNRLIELGAVSKEAAAFLKYLVTAGYNIFILGGTGSGKTTFLNALSQYIPQNERVITIEDSAELKLQNLENLVSLEARNANSEGCKAITIRELIKTALRMRPERIIVGECRGEEAIDMLQAMNTGHDGSLSTGHGNSPRDMISRLETMVLMGCDMPLHAIRGQIYGGIDIFIHLGRFRDKSRRVVSIEEVVGFENDEILLNTIFETNDQVLEKVGSLKKRDKLYRHYSKEEIADLSDEL